MSTIIQGASALTPRKELEIEGVAYMRLLQLKGPKPSRYFDRVIIADVFSGEGRNILGPDMDSIDGSPLRLLSAFRRAYEGGRGPMGLYGKRIDFYFSDIRQGAVSALRGRLLDELPPGLASIHVNKMSADDAVLALKQELISDTGNRTHLFLVLDPNGPKAFPRDQVLDLLGAFSDKIDLIVYISATAVNRCLQHRDKCGAHYDWWLSSIDRLDTDFVLRLVDTPVYKGRMGWRRAGWIREPIQNDPQKWFLLPTFTRRLKTHNDWPAQGLVDIRSPRGLEALRIYSGQKRVS